jgi:putative membrane protein
MLSTVANVFVALIALLHVYILVLEMFLWTTPRGRKAFGLAWGLCLGPAGYGAKLFFLGCILVAGVYGGITATRKILFIQAIPAAIGIALVMAAANG